MTTEQTTTQSSRGQADGPSRAGLRLPGWLKAWPLPARIAFVTTGALLVLIVLAAGADAVVSTGRIHPGVRVGDVAVGGQTPAEASASIASYIADRSATPVIVRAGQATWEVSAESVSLSADTTALAGDAFAVGRGEA